MPLREKSRREHLASCPSESDQGGSLWPHAPLREKGGVSGLILHPGTMMAPRRRPVTRVLYLDYWIGVILNPQEANILLDDSSDDDSVCTEGAEGMPPSRELPSSPPRYDDSSAQPKPSVITNTPQ